MKIRIGTRASKLALAQTNLVIRELESMDPAVEIEIVKISTKGDKDRKKPLEKLGDNGVFVKEIEQALHRGAIDLAVHSAKDLPTELQEGLFIAATLPRGSAFDVLLTKKGFDFERARSPIVGTGSNRRKIGLQQLYPNVVLSDIRGNVDTRLQKLRAGDYDAVVLAKAGLARLGADVSDLCVREFSVGEMIPAPTQGIIAVEARCGDAVASFAENISEATTYESFVCEREVLRALHANCHMPVGAYAKVYEDKIVLDITTDGKNHLHGERVRADALLLARELVEEAIHKETQG